jgi:hypothetical protein
MPHLLWHGASVFPVSSEGPPHSVASYDTWRDVEDLFYKFESSRGCWIDRWKDNFIHNSFVVCTVFRKGL